MGFNSRSLRYDNLHPSQQISGNGGSLTPDFALDYGANVNANFVGSRIKGGLMAGRIEQLIGVTIDTGVKLYRGMSINEYKGPV